MAASVAMGTCPLCNKSFPQGPTLNRHVDQCLSGIDDGPAVPAISFPSQSSFGSPNVASSKSSTPMATGYAISDLEADVSEIESRLERIIRSVDALGPEWHGRATSLYERLKICLDGSQKRINIYTSAAMLPPPPGAFYSPAPGASGSSSATIGGSAVAVPQLFYAPGPSTSDPFGDLGFGGGKGASSQPVQHQQEEFVDFMDTEAANERLFEELMRAEGTCSLCNVFKGAENLRMESCTRDVDHRFCVDCLRGVFADRINGRTAPTSACPVPNCVNEQLSRGTLRFALNDQQIESLEQLQLESFMKASGSFAKCPKCNFGFERISNSSSGGAAVGETGLDGKPLSAEAIVHRDKSRYRCPQCSDNFCAECNVAPYHLGYTCATYENYQNAKHCRFCDEALTRANTSRGGGPGVSGMVCTGEECQAKKKMACGKLLSCTHPCCGVKSEETCLPCMEEECESAVGTFKDEYCNICYTEGLGSAPTIRIACGHFFHYSCMLQKLSKKWTGSRITFNFLTCPLCKQIVDHPQLRDQLAPMMKLLAEIRGKAEQRLKIEGNDKDAALCEPSGRYYKKPVDYAMDKFAYYPCFKCKQPYFGGQRQCDAAQAQAANGREAAEDFDASHLICGGCADVGQECKVHGKEFIEWKCKFCCSISNWFCWGNTHFCDSCHKRQVAGDYMTKKKVADLPACPGPALCPLKGEHQPPLTEVCLGCVLCRTNTI